MVFFCCGVLTAVLATSLLDRGLSHELEWTVGSWSSCPEACGLIGTQTRTVTCSSPIAGACDSLVQPDATRSCPTNMCSWNTGAWGTCSVACDQGVGTQTRTVSCSSAIAGACDISTEPDKTRACSSVCSWTISSWSSCSEACGPSMQTRTLTCSDASAGACDNLVQPMTTRSCLTDMCSWNTGAWGACSVACDQGVGTQTRTVSCSSAVAGACDIMTQPNNTRECSSFCPWTTSAWSSCSKACGQGDGTQTRMVVCSAEGSGTCDATLKPSTTQICTSLCPWVGASWGACNCATGTRARCVTCSGTTDAECGSQERPDEQEACTPTNCGCHDNGDHDPMRPWGRDHADMSCKTQWWIIFVIIIASLLAFCCCLAAIAMLSRRKTNEPKPMKNEPEPVVPQEEKNQIREVVGAEDGQDVVEYI